MGPDSDFDLLVDFLPEAHPCLLSVAARARELTAVPGRRRGLAIEPVLQHRLSPTVLAEARLIYTVM